MHISMFHGTPNDYVQVTCHQEKYQDKLKALGFVTSVSELKAEAAKPRQEPRAKLTRHESK